MNEEEFIIECARKIVRPEIEISDMFFEKNVLDWDLVIAALKRHGLLGFIYPVFKNSGLISKLDKKTGKMLKAGMIWAKEESRRKKKEIRELGKIFEKENIQLTLLKGASYLYTLYKERPYREMGDIDILISKKDKSKIKKILEENNFKKFSWFRNDWDNEISEKIISLFQKEEYSKDKLYLDIHYEILYYVGQKKLSLDNSELWDKSKKLTNLPSSINFLTPKENIKVSSIHALDLYSPKLIQLVDLALIKKQNNLTEEKILEYLKDIDKKTPINSKKLVEIIQYLSEPIKGKHFSQEGKKLLDKFTKGKKHFEPKKTIFKRFLENHQKPKTVFKFLKGYLIPNKKYYNKSKIGSYLEHYKIHLKNLIKRL